MRHLQIDLSELRRDAAEYVRDIDAMEEKRRIDYVNKIGFDALMRQRIDRAHAAFMARHAAGGIPYSGDMRSRVHIKKPI